MGGQIGSNGTPGSGPQPSRAGQLPAGALRRALGMGRPRRATMNAAAPGPVTRLLIQWGQGKEEALQELMPLVYDELRDVARRYLEREPETNTLQSAGLVHEAYFRLVDQTRTTWKNRA